MNTQELRDAALKATPGPRDLADHGDYTDYNGNCHVILSEGCTRRMAIVLGGDNPRDRANAILMASASPERILAMLDCVEALQRIADPRNTHFSGDARVVAAAALKKLEEV